MAFGQRAPVIVVSQFRQDHWKMHKKRKAELIKRGIEAEEAQVAANAAIVLMLWAIQVIPKFTEIFSNPRILFEIVKGSN